MYYKTGPLICQQIQKQLFNQCNERSIIQINISKEEDTVARNIQCLMLVFLFVCLLSGCTVGGSSFRIDKIDGDIECEFRIGKSAQFSKNVVKTDAVFDKQRFIDLFNEREQYTSGRVRRHLDRCDLKINAKDQPDKIDKMSRSEINIKIVYDGVDEKRDSVSVYYYDSKLYFFVVFMGSNSRPEEIGYYYMEVPEDMQEYWIPILDKVKKDAEAGTDL